MSGCRVLVCGGRDFANRDLLFAALDALHAKRNFAVVIHGDARGADRLAGDWADFRGVRQQPFPADWARYGSRAGPIRNQQMIHEAFPTLVVAFEGGPGTADMSRRAFRAGIELLEVRTLLDVGVDVVAETNPRANRARHYGERDPRSQSHVAEAVCGDWMPDHSGSWRTGRRRSSKPHYD